MTSSKLSEENPDLPHRVFFRTRGTGRKSSRVFGNKLMAIDFVKDKFDVFFQLASEKPLELTTTRKMVQGGFKVNKVLCQCGSGAKKLVSEAFCSLCAEPNRPFVF